MTTNTQTNRLNPTFARITFNDGRRVTLRIVRDTPTLITGIVVNNEAEEVKPKGADETMHVFTPGDVKKRVPLAISWKYGNLVTLDHERDGIA